MILTIEKAFTIKFNELFPEVPLDPMVTPIDTTGLYCVFKCSNRQIEVDLQNTTHAASAVISIYVTGDKYPEVCLFIWRIINELTKELGVYVDEAPDVSGIEVLSNNDTYSSDLALYQTQIDLQYYF